MFPSEGFVREHYFELLSAVRRELESHRPRNGENKTDGDSDAPMQMFDTIRNDCPEITARIYSYLPLRDRIYTLSLVNKAFSRDPIRGGIVCATYGRGLNLKHALLEVEEFWSSRSDLYGEWSDSEVSSDLQENCDHIVKIKEYANASNGERLLVTGSNVKHPSVDSEERKRWVANHVRDFFGNEKRQREITRDFGRSWLTETILVQALLKRYFFDGTIGRLQQLFRQFDCEDVYKDYLSKQAYSKDNEKENGQWEWCLPDLSPGCHLWLPDMESSSSNRRLCGGNWKRHEFFTCRGCRKLHENCVRVGCHHGHCSYFCKDCCFCWFTDYSDFKAYIEGMVPRIFIACIDCRESLSGDFGAVRRDESGQWTW